MSKRIDARGREWLYGFDALGRQTSQTQPLGQSESYQFDLRGRQFLNISFDGVYTRTVFDDSAAGAGRAREVQYFSNSTAYNNGAGTPTERMTMAYDAFGRMVKRSTIVQESLSQTSTLGRMTRAAD